MVDSSNYQSMLSNFKKLITQYYGSSSTISTTISELPTTQTGVIFDDFIISSREHGVPEHQLQKMWEELMANASDNEESSTSARPAPVAYPTHGYGYNVHAQYVPVVLIGSQQYAYYMMQYQNMYASYMSWTQYQAHILATYQIELQGDRPVGENSSTLAYNDSQEQSYNGYYNI